jgi:hypothetical protein
VGEVGGAGLAVVAAARGVLAPALEEVADEHGQVELALVAAATAVATSVSLRRGGPDDDDDAILCRGTDDATL